MWSVVPPNAMTRASECIEVNHALKEESFHSIKRQHIIQLLYYLREESQERSHF